MREDGSRAVPPFFSYRLAEATGLSLNMKDNGLFFTSVMLYNIYKNKNNKK